EKEGKRKTKGAPLPIVPTLQKFLKTYEKHCAQAQTSVCPAIKRDLKTSINHERILRKFILVRPDDSPPSILPISLEPLLMTVQDECYMLGREICIWGFQLSNPEIARLALLLESKGCNPCPFTTLKLIDCKMDPWPLGRLGRALQFSSCIFLSSITAIPVLEPKICTGGKKEGISIFRKQLTLIVSGNPAAAKTPRFVRVDELHLDGNHLQCSGDLDLLRPLAEYAEMQGKDQPATSSPDPRNPPQVLQGK
ncbi:hypothetical protein E2I00_017995, partial [Balaenoptera physalus]